MQTTLEKRGWAAASRVKGCMRYYAKSLGLMDGAALIAMTLSTLISYAIMRAAGTCEITGPSANTAIAFILAFVCACWATKHGARFLSRFGTPRTSVWLATTVSLIVWMLALLVALLAIQTLMSGAVLLLSNAYPDSYRIVSYSDASLSSAQAFSKGLTDALGALPMQALALAEWCCVFCFIGACLRRNKWLTLGVLVGVPIVLGITLLIPAIRETIASMENADQSQLMLLGMKWMAWFSRVTQWVERNWQLVQGGMAVASLPLGWLVMRNTAQP